MTLAVGELLDDKYRIVRVLGLGGMGEVYEGEHARIRRRVAIKVLHASVAQKAEIVQRFEREAQAAGRIGSEHIVEVLDLGRLPTGQRYMVMEYLDGESLMQRIKARGRLPAGEVATLLRQLLDGLWAAHAAGIVHRDLKPDNIYIVQRGGREFVKILDFGVSKFTTRADEELSMTKTGSVVGTPYYMSPEQARGQTIDHRSDLYSVGVVAYEAVSGRVPFRADTFNELIFKIALESPEPVESVVPDLDQGIAAIIGRAMERDPAHRFQDAVEFAYAVDTWRGVARATVQQQRHGVAQPGAQPLSLSQQTQHLAQSPSGQFNPVWSQPGTPQPSQLGSSQPGHSQYGPGFTHPGHPHAQPALSQSGNTSAAGGTQMHASGANLDLAPRRNGHPMGQSQVGLAVTTAPRKAAPLLLISLGLVSALGVGLGVVAYVLRAPEAKPPPAAEAKALGAEPATPMATATATQALSGVEVAASATTSTSASTTATPTAKAARVPGKTPKPPPTPPTATTSGGGRTITDKL